MFSLFCICNVRVLIFSFTPYRFKGVVTTVTTPLKLGVNDYLGCSICGVDFILCTLYVYIAIAPSGTVMRLP